MRRYLFKLKTWIHVKVPCWWRTKVCIRCEGDYRTHRWFGKLCPNCLLKVIFQEDEFETSQTLLSNEHQDKKKE